MSPASSQPVDPVSSFTNHLPVRIRFGVGTLSELPTIVEEVGAHRIAALIDPGVRSLPAVTAALDTARPVDVRVVEPGEPTIASIDRAGEWLRGLDADLVVAIGGGSTLDTAKGARLVSEAGGSLSRYAFPDPEPVETLRTPLVTVPTTAGTGSEVTGGIVAVDPATGLKIGAAGAHNRAQHCLVDPTLTFTLPAAPTLYGGIDALAQGAAAVIVSVHTPVGDALGLEAVRLAAQALPAVVSDPTDHNARIAMSCSSLLAGLAMNVAEAGTEHSLAHALGTRFHLPHGLTVGLVLAESLDHDRQFVPERMERVADALGEARTTERDGSRAPRAVRRLLAEIGFPTVRTVGVTEADVEVLTDLALRGWIPVEPGPWTREDVAAAYRRALAVDERH